MASDKKRRMAKKSKYATKTGEFRHSDGDRRARDAMTRAVRDYKARQKFTGGVPIDDPPAQS